MSLSDWTWIWVSWSDWTRSCPGTNRIDVSWSDWIRNCPVDRRCQSNNKFNRIDVSWSNWMRNYLLDRRCQSNNKYNIMSWSECRVRKKREKMWEFGGPWTAGLWGTPRKEVRTRWTVRKKRENIRVFGGPGTTGSFTPYVSNFR